MSMIHVCTIERDAQAADDPWGNPDTPDWQVLYREVPCRAWMVAGKETATDDRTVVISDLRLIVPLGTDVTERDRIGDVYARGEAAFVGPFQIELVIRQPDHLELMLERYS
jgi:hypothetical protein